jgi:hypothetical protein
MGVVLDDNGLRVESRGGSGVTTGTALGNSGSRGERQGRPGVVAVAA